MKKETHALMASTWQPHNPPRYSLADVHTIWQGYVRVSSMQDLTDTLGKTAIETQVDTLWDGKFQTQDSPRDAAKTVWEGGDGLESDLDEAQTAWIPSDAEAAEADSNVAYASGFQVSSPAHAQMPSDFGFEVHQDFDLLRRIGDGSMALVLEAYQASMDRYVALKMIKPEFSCDDTARSKFIREARVTANLTHPNIVPIYEISDVRDVLLFYVMKYVTGTSWADALAHNSEADNLAILLHVCDAVSFAHNKGILHRDLKPENVMLGDFGEVLVMDWGLAVGLHDNTRAERLTEQTGAGGTPAYMAPEMARRDNRHIGPWSDIYLLGGILYEIVSGRRPHTGSTVEECLLMAMNNEIQPAAHDLGELGAIALKAMRANPKERYARVKDFQRAIREYQDHTQSIALAVSARQDFAQARRTHQYNDYVRSLFGFRDALRIWHGNADARQGAADVSLAYAECAYQHGDYDLALSLLNARLAGHAALYGTVETARQIRDRHKKRSQLLHYGLWMGLSALAGGLLTLGALALR